MKDEGRTRHSCDVLSIIEGLLGEEVSQKTSELFGEWFDAGEGTDKY